ncbi:MAG: hypothetical protein ACOYB1_00275 [Limnohabitans sp.]
MKKIWKKKTLSIPGDEFVDVVVKKSAGEKIRLLTGALTLVIICVAAGYFAYRQIYLPQKWRAEVSKALDQIGKEDAEWKGRLETQSEVARLEAIGAVLPIEEKSTIPYKERVSAAIAALELADHLGSMAARYIYGSHLEDGSLPSTDSSLADRQFALAHKRVAKGVDAGEPIPIFYYGLMLSAGQGVESNYLKSLALINKVLEELPKRELKLLFAKMTYRNEFYLKAEDRNFIHTVANARIKKGDVLDEIEVQEACRDQRSTNLCVRGLENASERNGKKELKFVPLDPNAKIDPLPQQASKSSQGGKKYITDAEVFGSRPTAPVPAADKELQTYTGYVKGSLQGSQGGLSTFTVDNRQGGADAIARLYLNGSKPAVRSMYVRSGDTFKAESLLPGNYVLRYRFIGSEDTFEADRIMSLKQVEGESGTQYSNVTVTLFKQVGGNLNTKKVPADQF